MYKIKIKHKAFTLIELLVVVAIIGILAAVGVVAYNGYIKSAKLSACKSNFKTVVSTFRTEHSACELKKISGLKATFLGQFDCDYWTTAQRTSLLGKARNKTHGVAPFFNNLKNPYDQNALYGPFVIWDAYSPGEISITPKTGPGHGVYLATVCPIDGVTKINCYTNFNNKNCIREFILFDTD